ncbi:MAG: lipid-A-disaccharide synthase [Flavobacteriales bacterium]
MRYYLIAGEESGDLHGSNLIRELKKLDVHAEFSAWGGDRMKAQGANLVKHIRDLAFMGFVEVLMNIKTIVRNINFCKQDLLTQKPDVLILIDYPGFNLRIAKFAHKNGIKVFYYISPQLWAWKASRVKIIKKYVDELFVILPFEKDFYQKYNYPVHFVGHPLLDAIENFKPNQQQQQSNVKNIVALLPGSRKQEIETMLPEMLKLCNRFPNYEFIICGTKNYGEDNYRKFSNNFPVKIVIGKTYEILAQAKVALVTSGTATLETALFQVPQVVCYKAGRLSYLIAKSLIKVKYISLVNLILDKQAIKELIQDKMNHLEMEKELRFLLDENSEARKKLIFDYTELREKLGGQGASERTARLMHDLLAVKS